MKTGIAVATAVAALMAAPLADADDDRNVLTVSTLSHKVACRVKSSKEFIGRVSGTDSVACQGRFAQQAQRSKSDGKLYYPLNNVATDGTGTALRWFSANMAAEDVYMPMEYGHTLTWGNWKIYPDESGTTFTNTRTGHGMFVSYEDVHVFLKRTVSLPVWIRV